MLDRRKKKWGSVAIGGIYAQNESEVKAVFALQRSCDNEVNNIERFAYAHKNEKCNIGFGIQE